MMNTTMLAKDLGTILVGADAVKEGLIDEVGESTRHFINCMRLYENRKTNACNDKRIKIWYTNAQC